MYISTLQVINYKSHFRSSELHLTRGFNLITGQNNAGKTALLEAIGLQFHSKPHLSLRTVPTATSRPDPRSWVDVSFIVSTEELQDILLVPDSSFYIPVPQHNSDFARSIDYASDDPGSAVKLKGWFFSNQELTFKLRLEVQPNVDRWVLRQFPTFADYLPPGHAHTFSEWRVNPDRSLSFGGFSSMVDENEVGLRVASTLRTRIYTFRAERFNSGSCAFGPNSQLESNARNLAEVLDGLQHNRDRFALFNRLLREVFPQIHWVSVRPHPLNAGEVEIVIWNHDPQTQRQDLAIPLNESGTGIGQVLAMLYVVLTSDFARTIIIDEPQSFLHRGAARKLIEILKRYPQHQLIVSTHSPTIISATNPKTITMIQQHESESITEILDAEEIEQQRRLLAEIGARPSDVFGADNILWVEGETEEQCFPQLLERIAGRSLMGTIVKAIKHTGDLEGKQANLVFEIYDRLSHGKSLLPSALAFILDDEGRTEQQKAEIRSRSHDRAFFIQRRMYENYLLNPEAIASLLNAIDGLRATRVTQAEIQALLTAKTNEERYYRPLPIPSVQLRLQIVNGALLLHDIFSEVSEARVVFDKLRHSVVLTEWIIEHAPDDLKEVSDLLVQILDTQHV